MRLAPTRLELDAALHSTRSTRSSGAGRVVLVPTMGALHAGHAALLRHARTVAGQGTVVASIFVNPRQFGPGEDLARYPRTLEADLDQCRDEGVDVVFAPAVDEVYPGGADAAQVSVDPGPLGAVLEGVSRPTHFAGVLTVVAKLFGMVRPQAAVFGEKDYQQLVLVRRLSAELCLGVEVLGAETVRDPDGLALSSRNRYLSASQRASALALSAALRAGAAAAAAGPEAVRRAALDVLTGAGAGAGAGAALAVNYLALTAPDLGPAPASGPARLLVAARVGPTRLIDNLPVRLGDTLPS